MNMERRNIISLIIIFLLIAGVIPSLYAQEIKEDRLTKLHQALNAASKQNDDKLAYEAINDLHHFYYEMGNFDSALFYAQESYNFAKKYDSPKALANSLASLADVYLSKDRFAKGVEYFSQAIPIYEKLGDKLTLARLYTTIGNNLAEREDFREALSYYQKALEKLAEEENHIIEGMVLQGIAGIYKEQKDWDLALENYQNSIELLSLQPEKGAFGIANAQMNMSQIYLVIKNLEKADSLVESSLKISKEIGDSLGMAYAYNFSSPIKKAKGDIDLAIAHSDSAIKIAKSLDVLDILATIYIYKTEMLESNNQFEEALSAHKSYKEVEDSILSRDKQEFISNFQEQFRTKEQQEQIKSLESQQKIKNLWLTGTIVVIILVSVIASLIYNRYQIKNKAHKKLDEAYSQLQQTQDQLIQTEKMASLGKMTAGIAHEIKNPLNFINNFSSSSKELAEEINDKVEEIKDNIKSEDYDQMKELTEMMKESADSIVKNGQRADEIVSGMMLHARKNEDEKIPTDLNQLVRQSAELAFQGFQSGETKLDMQILYHLDPALPQIAILPQEIGQAILNLVNNACEAVEQRSSKEKIKPQIEVYTSTSNGKVEIRVKDNGSGIPEKMKKEVFQPFFTTKPTGKGNAGLGLSIAYESIVKGHQGSIHVESESGQGTDFVIQLPI